MSIPESGARELTPLRVLKEAESRLCEALVMIKIDSDMDGATAEQIDTSLTFCFSVIDLLTNDLDRHTLKGQRRVDRMESRLAGAKEEGS